MGGGHGAVDEIRYGLCQGDVIQRLDKGEDVVKNRCNDVHQQFSGGGRVNRPYSAVQKFCGSLSDPPPVPVVREEAVNLFQYIIEQLGDTLAQFFKGGVPAAEDGGNALAQLPDDGFYVFQGCGQIGQQLVIVQVFEPLGDAPAYILCGAENIVENLPDKFKDVVPRIVIFPGLCKAARDVPDKLNNVLDNPQDQIERFGGFFAVKGLHKAFSHNIQQSQDFLQRLSDGVKNTGQIQIGSQLPQGFRNAFDGRQDALNNTQQRSEDFRTVLARCPGFCEGPDDIVQNNQEVGENIRQILQDFRRPFIVQGFYEAGSDGFYKQFDVLQQCFQIGEQVCQVEGGYPLLKNLQNAFCCLQNIVQDAPQGHKGIVQVIVEGQGFREFSGQFSDDFRNQRKDIHKEL